MEPTTQHVINQIILEGLAFFRFLAPYGVIVGGVVLLFKLIRSALRGFSGRGGY